MLLLMIERGMPIDIVLTADTGMEFPEMYDHLAKLDEYLYRERGIHLTMLRHPKGFEYMMFEEEKQKISSIENRQKLGVPLYGNGWPGVRVRWCTGQLKTHLIAKEVNRLKGKYDAKKAAYQEVTILGRPALFAECRIDNSTVPKGLYRYELRHGDENWGDPVSLSRNIIVNYYGAVLTREPFQLPIEGWIPLEDDSLSFQDGGCRTLAEFQRKYPVSKKDVIDFFVANDDSLHDFYFSHSEAQDKATGCVGHLRGDFGSGKQFFTTWWPHQGDQLNTPAFKADIDRAVNWLREQPDSPLHDFDTMKRFCGRFERSCAIKGAMLPSYAFMAKTKQYVYMIRCTPVKGDYQFYIYCYQRKAFEKARGKQQKNDRPPAKKRAEPER